MKTVRLLKTADMVVINPFSGNQKEVLPGHYMTEDGMFGVHYESKGGMCVEGGWLIIAVTTRQVVAKGLASLRCARVWIKNFYRTLTIVEPKSEIVPLLAKEQSAVNNIDSFLPKKGKFVLNYDAELEPDLVHLEGTIHYLWVPIAEFFLSNTYNY
jgi:hypothetical protein